MILRRNFIPSFMKPLTLDRVERIAKRDLKQIVYFHVFTQIPSFGDFFHSCVASPHSFTLQANNTSSSLGASLSLGPFLKISKMHLFLVTSLLRKSLSIEKLSSWRFKTPMFSLATNTVSCFPQRVRFCDLFLRKSLQNVYQSLNNGSLSVSCCFH